MAARRGWFRRDDADAPGEEVELTARELAAHHLLLVPSTVPLDVVDQLVRDWVPTSRLGETGEVQLGRETRITGPFELSMEDAVDAAVPMPWTVVFSLNTPVDREDPPLPGTDDRDGFAFAFPEGLPWRDEARALHLLVSLARRIGGAVRMAGSFEVVQPDPDRAVDHLVHAPFWVDPEVLCGVVARELPSVRLATEGEEWAGPGEAVYSGAVIAEALADEPLRADELEALHAHADRMDMNALAAPDILDAYALVGEVGPGAQDGAVEVLAHVAEGVEPAVAGEEWASRSFVTYEIRWMPPDPAERERRTPSAAYLASRKQVKPVIAAITLAVIEVTSGLVVDEDGFRVDRYQL